MSGPVKLTRDDEWVLQQAYLLKPQGSFNLSSVLLFSNDINAHDSFDFTAFQRLTDLGYVVGVDDRIWEFEGRTVDVVIFRLTPLGVAQAEKLIAERRQYSIRERLAGATGLPWLHFWSPSSLFFRQTADATLL